MNAHDAKTYFCWKDKQDYDTEMDYYRTIIDDISDEAVSTLWEEGFPFHNLPEILNEISSYLSSKGIFSKKSFIDGLQIILPRCGEELIATVALSRPYPAENNFVDDYLDRKKNGAFYDHPALEQILRESYGLILYREQVETIATDFSGFRCEDAASLCRAIAKLDWEKIERLHRQFIDGAEYNGHTRGDAEKIWIIQFQAARWVGSRKIAMEISDLAYQMAYLKVHHPEELQKALKKHKFTN